MEIKEGIAIFRDGIGHDAFWNESVVFHAVKSILEGTALTETGVAMSADMLVGTVNISFADEERLAQVEVVLHFRVLLDSFTLQKSQRRISPAGSAAGLVLN